MLMIVGLCCRPSLQVDGSGKYAVWVEPMFDLTGTSEHAHNDHFDGLVRRIARRRQARNTAQLKRIMPARPTSPALYLRATVVKYVATSHAFKSMLLTLTRVLRV